MINKNNLAAKILTAQLSLFSSFGAVAGEVTATFPDGSHKQVPCDGAVNLKGKKYYTCGFAKAADKNNQDICPEDYPKTLDELQQYDAGTQEEILIKIRSMAQEHYAQTHQDCEYEALTERSRLKKAGQYKNELLQSIKPGWQNRKHCTVIDVVKACESQHGIPTLK